MAEEAQNRGSAPLRGDTSEMPLMAHLRELRRRVVISVAVILVAFLFTYSYAAELYALLTKPLIPVLPEGDQQMAFTGVVEPFFTYLKAAIVAALIISSPVLLYQMWAFIAPGLHKEERVWFLPVIFVSVLLFLGGVYFAYEVVLPMGLAYLIGYAGPSLQPVIVIGEYFTLAIKFLLSFGIVFQIPLVILVLSRLGVVDAGMLIRGWRVALLASVIAGALLTPPDIVSQLLLGGPIMGLYASGIIRAAIFGKGKGKVKGKGKSKKKDEED